MGFLILDKNLKFCYTYDVIGRISAQALPRYEAIYQYGLVRAAITNAVTLNRYAYANANPITNVDPLGLLAKDLKPIKENSVMMFDGGGGAGTVVAPKPSPTATAPATSITPDAPSHSEYATIKDGISDYNYIFSSDPYWEDLLTNNDAIYVVDYGKSGLDTVGHAYLYLKKDDNSWIKTEQAAGRGENVIEKKHNATVKTSPVNADEIISSLSVAPQIDSYDITIQSAGDPSFPIEVTIDNYVDGVQYIAIKGDFSKSVSKAEELGGDKYRYGYFLPTNNCLHYVRNILREGKADDYSLEVYIHLSTTAVPKDFFGGLTNISK